MSLNSKGDAAQACQHAVTQQISFHVFHEQIPCPALGIAQMVSTATIQGLRRPKDLGGGEFLFPVLTAVLLRSEGSE